MVNWIINSVKKKMFPHISEKIVPVLGNLVILTGYKDLKD